MMRSTMYSTMSCPHCTRTFAPRAAERHIPICKNIQHKPKTTAEALPPKGRGGAALVLPTLSHTQYDKKAFSVRSKGSGKSSMLSTTSVPEAGFPPTNKYEMMISEHAGAPTFCTCCGWKYREKDRFCGGCGEKRT